MILSGFVGAIAGMSEGGLTVHEAASDVKQETFLGRNNYSFLTEKFLRICMDIKIKIYNGKC